MTDEQWLPGPGTVVGLLPDGTRRIVCNFTDPSDGGVLRNAARLHRSATHGLEMMQWIAAHIPEQRWPTGLRAKINLTASVLADVDRDVVP